MASAPVGSTPVTEDGRTIGHVITEAATLGDTLIASYTAVMADGAPARRIDRVRRQMTGAHTYPTLEQARGAILELHRLRAHIRGCEDPTCNHWAL